MMKSSTLRCSLGSIQSSGLNLPSLKVPRGTKQPIWQERSSTGNSSMRRAPLSPAMSRDQLASTPHPSGVTSPSPVMTTRRSMALPLPFVVSGGRLPSPAQAALAQGYAADAGSASGGACVLLEELDRVADRLDLLGGIIGDLAAELFLESHHQLDRIQAVGAQIIDETRVVGDLVGLHA